MNATQEIFNDHVKQLSALQSRSIEPLRIFGSFTADAAEQMMRQHYAVMGDIVDYTVKQSQLPLSIDAASDVVAAQVAETNAFGERMSSRASEYASMASSFTDRARQAAEEATASIKAA